MSASTSRRTGTTLLTSGLLSASVSVTNAGPGTALLSNGTQLAAAGSTTVANSSGLTVTVPAGTYADITVDPGSDSVASTGGSVTTQATVGLAEKNTIRSHVVIEMNADSNAYTFPARIRPVEPSRKLVIVENIGTTVIQLAYSTLGNVSWATPVTAQWTAGPTLQPGQAWRDTGTAQSLFMRPFTSGQSAAIGVYTELGVL